MGGLGGQGLVLVNLGCGGAGVLFPAYFHCISTYFRLISALFPLYFRSISLASALLSVHYPQTWT